MPNLPDVNTGLEALAASQAAKTFLGPLAERVLGPTADYLGEGLQGWTERRRRNVERIFGKADALLVDEQRATGSVPPKVLKQILDQGSFCDDELTASYFGGVLASSKSEITRDDRGATLAALVGRLSAYEIRTHYLLYAHAQRRLAGSDFNLGMDQERQQHARIFLPTEVWMTGMAFTHEEAPIVGDVMSDVVQGLLREDLIEIPFGFGSVDAIAPVGFANVGFGFATQLSPLGVQLFVWAHGHSRQTFRCFLDASSDFHVHHNAPSLPDGALVLADMRAVAAAAASVEGQAAPPETTEPT